MARTAALAGFDRVIGFDMGGTSTDVSHFAGEFERELETQVAGVRMRAPMMSIHTVAAGGGSILHFDGPRYRVGPGLAGADPGPACYRRGGPLTVTDANSCSAGSSPTSSRTSSAPRGPAARRRCGPRAFRRPRARGGAGDRQRAHARGIAEGCLEIAVGQHANAVKQISVQRGHDVTEG